MNKRIRKKNDIDRINGRIFEIAIKAGIEVADTYAHLKGYEESNEIFWQNCEEEYDKWIKLPCGKRCWTYILKKHNIPKYIGYKNKTIRT